MPREFELRKEMDLDASPEQVWDAIATGPGITSWFMTHEVEPGVGGKVTLRLDDFAVESTITTWDPPHRLVVRGGSEEQPHIFEYLIEGRKGASTVFRFVQSGFLGDDWESEYDSMNQGWDMYLHTLAQYLRYFPGRTAKFVLAAGPEVSAREQAWPVLMRAIGASASTAVGDKIEFAPEGLAPIKGVVDYLVPTFLGLRTSDGLYRFHGRASLAMPVAVGHHIFSADAQVGKVWESWLAGVFRPNRQL